MSEAIAVVAWRTIGGRVQEFGAMTEIHTKPDLHVELSCKTCLRRAVFGRIDHAQAERLAKLFDVLHIWEHDR